MVGTVRRCRQPIRACLLASVFSLVICIIVYVFTISIFTKSTTMSPNLWSRVHVNSSEVYEVTQQHVVAITSRMHELRLHKYLNIFNASEETEEERNSTNDNMCVSLKTTPEPTPVCIYDPKIDIWVSGSIVKYGLWEKEGTYLMASILTQNPEMQLLDIGSNIGVFTLQAAKLGRKVIAVDANKFNLRLLAKSLYLGGLQKYVTLVWNAVTDVHEAIELTITTGNIGGSFVKSAGEVNQQPNPKYTVQTALAITLEDLIGFVKDSPIFMKIDIEGSEWKAFRGGEIFLQEVNVRYILMEWATYKKGNNGLELLRLMYTFGFQPHSPKGSMPKLNLEKWDSWPGDVLWIRE